MNPDHRDPLHDSRNAMTAWERSLRPARERHWAMWIALSVLLLFGLYQGAEWLLAQRITPLPKPPSVIPSAPVTPPSARRTAPPSAAELPGDSAAPGFFDEVAKCMSASGKAAYSDGPCPAGSTATTVRLRRDQNLADGMSVEAREASTRNNAALAAQQQQSHEWHVERDVVGSSAQAAGCSGLDAHVKWLDTMARQPQAASTQDWLRNERQQTRDQRFRLGCR
ncbi:hypothetical protein [Variovorax paradoxus]|uniref:hypothetical protein n=1 Tax=Variovorax paradoxus TaxID=34073 RepID=UPI002781AC56|nr:hypothetical protein [Variovorax paradoxus]MDQ0588450.1 hypothetical protein [Variovorax paradoxus]